MLGDYTTLCLLGDINSTDAQLLYNDNAMHSAENHIKSEPKKGGLGPDPPPLKFLHTQWFDGK
jgi:hypothetical protein